LTILGEMTTIETPSHGIFSDATATGSHSTSTFSFLSPSSQQLLEKLRAADTKRGAAGKWAEVKNGLFRVSNSSGGAPNISSTSSAMLQRGHDDLRQITKKCVEALGKHVPVTSLELMREKLEECAHNVINEDTNTPMQFTSQNAYDLFLSSDTFYVEIKLNPLAISKNDTGLSLLRDSNDLALNENVLVNDVKIYHTDDPISCKEMVKLLNDHKFDEFMLHLKGIMAIYDNFQSDCVNRSKIWLSLRALEEDLEVLANIQGTSSSLKHDVASLVLRAPVGVLTSRVGGKPLRLTYFVSPYDLLDAEKKEVIPWSLNSLTERKLGRRVAVTIEAIPPSAANSILVGRVEPNCHRMQHMALLTIKTNDTGKKFHHLPHLPEIILLSLQQDLHYVWMTVLCCRVQ